MRRPVVFAVECVLALVLATVGAWIADRFSRKANRQAAGTERMAAALERIAAAVEPRVIDKCKDHLYVYGKKGQDDYLVCSDGSFQVVK